MGIDLNNLHLTLDQFNAAASGKYNIGQLKLSEDGTSVYRTNNHKTWTIFNNTTISPEESLALKTTFCQALANEGLSPDEIASVKEKLGIGGNAIDVMKAGSIKPLSAAEVREVIDKYAGKINENRGADGAAKLKTSTEIYKGVSKQTLESRETTRNKVNAQTVDSMISEADKSVNDVLDILQFTGEGETETLSNIQKGIANEIASLMRKPGELPGKENPAQLQCTLASLHEGDDSKIVVTFMLEGGNTFSVNTGLEREELLAQMDKAIAGKPGGAATSAGETTAKPKVESAKTQSTGEEKKVKTQSSKLTGNQSNIIGGIEDALTLMDPNDRKSFNAKVESEKSTIIRHERDKLEKARKKLESKPNADTKQLKTVDEVMASDNFKMKVAAKAKDEVRSEVVKRVVEPLQKELHRLRGLDERNVQLVNKVRDALAGDTSIDRKQLVEEIKLAFSEKIVNSADKVMEELQQGVEDDIDENLNINAWLGRKS